MQSHFKLYDLCDLMIHTSWNRSQKQKPIQNFIIMGGRFESMNENKVLLLSSINILMLTHISVYEQTFIF
jgi:hypothetical protein